MALESNKLKSQEEVKKPKLTKRQIEDREFARQEKRRRRNRDRAVFREYQDEQMTYIADHKKKKIIFKKFFKMVGRQLHRRLFRTLHVRFFNWLLRLFSLFARSSVQEFSLVIVLFFVLPLTLYLVDYTLTHHQFAFTVGKQHFVMPFMVLYSFLVITVIVGCTFLNRWFVLAAYKIELAYHESYKKVYLPQTESVEERKEWQNKHTALYLDLNGVRFLILMLALTSPLSIAYLCTCATPTFFYFHGSYNKT